MMTQLDIDRALSEIPYPGRQHFVSGGEFVPWGRVSPCGVAGRF